MELRCRGPTDDPAVNALRSRQQRNILATLLLSQGVPMLLGGDEMGRSQGGNDDGYCQDNEISWHDWETIDEPLLEFTRRLIHFRHERPVFHRRSWFEGRPLHGPGVSDIEWFEPNGTEMSDSDWETAAISVLGIFLSPEGLTDMDGQPVSDHSSFLAFNAGARDRRFRLPGERLGRRWRTILATAAELPFPTRGRLYRSGWRVPVPARSIKVLQRADD